jgi:hypothetical protein
MEGLMTEWLIKLFADHPVLGTILAGLLAAHALAVFVVNLTPTPKDNEWVARIYRGLEWLGGIVTKKVKE